MLHKLAQIRRCPRCPPSITLISTSCCSGPPPPCLLTEINSLLSEPMKRDESRLNLVMHEVRTLDPFANDIKLNMAASHFTAMYHTLKMKKASVDPSDGSNSDDLIRLKQERTEDMKFGWILLQNVVDNADCNDTKMEAVVLKLKFATTMKDFRLLRDAYNSMLEISDSRLNEKEEKEFSDQHLMLCFTTASFLGDWSNVYKFGEVIHGINAKADEPPTGFDIMFEICKNERLHFAEKDEETTLKWETLPIRKIRIKLKDIDCEQFEEKREEAMKEILGSNTLESVQWEDVKDEYASLIRMGAMCSTPSFCQDPLTLYGVWRDDRINVIGRERFIDGQRQTSVLEEEWDLKRNDDVDRLFVGTYRLSQTVELSPNVIRTVETAPIHMVWDIEIYFSEPKSDL